MPLIVDPSAILALALADEASDYAASVVDAIAAEGALVPALFWFEIRNVLIVNERRDRLTIAQTSLFLSSLESLPFEISSPPSESTVLALAREHRLTVYDAAYLELALRRQLPLATLDKALRATAVKISLPVFLDP